MSNISNTRRMQADPLETIVERLNRTMAKVSRLRLSLDELEIDLIQIRQQCENTIRTHPPVASVDNARDKCSDAPKSQSQQPHRAKMPPGSVSLQGWSRKPDRPKVGTSRGQTGESKEQQERGAESPILESKLDLTSNPATPQLFMKTQSKSRLISPSRIPRLSSSRSSGGRGLPAVIAIEKDGNSSALCSQSRTALAEAEVQGSKVLIHSCRHAEKPPIAIQSRPSHPPHPPTNPFPFSKGIDLSSYPPDLKRKGVDWFVLFNPSPKVKQILDVNLVHDLTHKSGVHSVKFSRDGKWVATGGQGTAQIYDVKTGVETCVFDHMHDVWIWSVCFSPDGKYLATGGDDEQIRIWNIAGKQIHSTFEGHQDSIYSLEFLSDGQFIISGSNDGSVRIWDVHRGALKVLTIEDYYPSDKHHGVWSVAISPDGRYLAVGAADTVVSIWEVPTGVLVKRLRGHRSVVSSVAFTPNGKGLISGSWDCTLKYWDMSQLDIGSGACTAITSTSSTSSPHCLMNLTGHTYFVNSIAISHDGIWVVSGCCDGKVLFWETRTGAAQYMLATHEDFASQADLSPVENVLATVDRGGRTRIWSYGIPG